MRKSILTAIMFAMCWRGLVGHGAHHVIISRLQMKLVLGLLTIRQRQVLLLNLWSVAFSYEVFYEAPTNSVRFKNRSDYPLELGLSRSYLIFCPGIDLQNQA